MARLLSAWAVLVLVSGGCGDDGGGPAPTDAGGTVDTGGGGDMCAGMADGTSCGASLVCFSGACVPEGCGDGIVDSAAGEECEDGNETAGDGCEPDTCTFSCSMDVDCDDDDPCNGAETCIVASHRCQAALPVDGGDCTRGDGSGGVCSAGMCAELGCGNNVIDGEEDCDDGQNGNDDDGCKDDCTFSCAEAGDCDDADMCNGAETCNTTTHVCEAGTALDCDDGDPCTADSCGATTGCANDVIDVDMDGFSPGVCTTPGVTGGDCLDTNNAVFPSNPDWYSADYTTGATTSFDWNCNGTIEQRYPSVAGTCALQCAGMFCICAGSGWSGSTIPACGAFANYRSCTLGGGCNTTTASRQQECH